MKTFLLACAVVMVVTGCSGPDEIDDVDAAAAPPAATTTSTPTPQPLTVTRVAMFPESGGKGLALCGHHFAYVNGTSDIVLADWKSGTSRTVFSTDHSFLYAVRQVGCRLEVHDTVNGYNGEDPNEPGRNLSVDLRTGRVTPSPVAPFRPAVVGRMGEHRSVELVEGSTWRSLVLLTPFHVELLSSTGQVTSVSMSGHHVAWADGVPDQGPDSVHVVDVADPDSPVVLKHGGSPWEVAVGTTFVAWTTDAGQFVAPTGGGPVVRVPGLRSAAMSVAAHGDLLARVVGTAGGFGVEVLRIDA